jgi:hypothetical protein
VIKNREFVITRLDGAARATLHFAARIRTMRKLRVVRARRDQQGIRRTIMRTFVLLAIVLLISADVSAVRADPSPEEQNACFIDAQRVCPGTIPNRELVFNCLVQNRPALSRLCRAAIERDVKTLPRPRG